MAKEIERKFLVINDSYRIMASNCHAIKQGYISTQKDAVVRVRIKDNSAFLTIKGINIDLVRDEWEYEIPIEEALEMLHKLVTGNIIDKTRYIVDYCGHKWEIDEFHGTLDGLVIAEIEITSPDQQIPIPQFIGKEVTGNPDYYNSALSCR